MRSLTQTARDFLSSLRRIPTVPSRDVKSLIEAEIDDPTVVDGWIDFHEQFAGYVVDVGHGDGAVWGLAHLNSRRLRPGTIEIDYLFENDRDSAYILCADCHPSFEHFLHKNGQFRNPPARDFGVHVERHAFLWNLGRQGPLSVIRRGELRDPQMITEWKKTVEVPEASDDFLRYSRGNGVALVWKADCSTPMRGWRC